jgi:3D (Asp-Asp-Asp) domain-containing protein
MLWGAAAAIAAGGLIGGTSIHAARLVIESPTGRSVRTGWTLDPTWRQLLSTWRVHWNRRDAFSEPLTSAVTHPLTIRRAVPVVVSTFRHRYHTWTTHYRVSAVLAELGLRLGHLDVVRPSLSSRIRPGQPIRVIRRWLVRRTVTTLLAYTTQYQPDPLLYRGDRAILRWGRDGRRLETVQILMQDGRALRRTVIPGRVITPPVNELVAYGSLDTIARGGQVVTFTRELTMTATAYWPDPSWSTGITATGVPAHYGIAAVDPAVIPLGTRLYVPGYGFALAEDTGSAIVGDRIDLCFNDPWQAIDWGVRTVDVFIVR